MCKDLEQRGRALLTTFSYALSSIYSRFDKTAHSNFILVVFNLWLFTADPPHATSEDIMISNLKLEGSMTVQEDQHFAATVTWNTPVYPYKQPISYLLKLFKEHSPQPMHFQLDGTFTSVSEICFLAQNIFSNLPIIISCSGPATKVNFAHGAFFIGNVLKQLRAILQESEANLEMKIFNSPSFFVWR